MPEKYELNYYPARGRAELIRLILAQAGIEFEDKRHKKEAWLKIKPTVPTKETPFLDYNGTKICQSIAIAHFVAKKGGLCGKDDVEAAQAEMVVHCLFDIVNKFVGHYMEKDEVRKERLKKEAEEALNETIKNLEGILITNGGDWMVGSGCTWADLAVADTLGCGFLPDYHKGMDVAAVSPVIAKHVEKVCNLPNINIKAWIDKRPADDMN